MPDPDRVLRHEVIIDASVQQVWDAWTTPEGLKSFFAPGCNVEARPGGPYEIFFMPDAAPGMRGGDGMVVLAVQPRQLLSFTWNAPPSLPEAREQRTHVAVRFFPTEAGKTRVTLVHGGWGTGGEWDQAFDYFQEAWSKVVLPRLQRRFLEGPVDWAAEPGPGGSGG